MPHGKIVVPLKISDHISFIIIIESINVMADIFYYISETGSCRWSAFQCSGPKSDFRICDGKQVSDVSPKNWYHFVKYHVPWKMIVQKQGKQISEDSWSLITRN